MRARGDGGTGRWRRWGGSRVLEDDGRGVLEWLGLSDVAELLPDVVELQLAIDLGGILVEGDDVLDGLGMGFLFLAGDA